MNTNGPRNFPGLATVVLYGCSPPTIPEVPWDPAPFTPQAFCQTHNCPIPCLMCALAAKSMPVVPIMMPCAKCNRHVRAGEPCPWCVRAELDALMRALGDKAQPVEHIERLRVALRKALGALRDVSKVTGGALEPLIAECEKALDA